MRPRPIFDLPLHIEQSLYQGPWTEKLYNCADGWSHFLLPQKILLAIIVTLFTLHNRLVWLTTWQQAILPQESQLLVGHVSVNPYYLWTCFNFVTTAIQPSHSLFAVSISAIVVSSF